MYIPVLFRIKFVYEYKYEGLQILRIFSTSYQNETNLPVLSTKHSRLFLSVANGRPTDLVIT